MNKERERNNYHFELANPNQLKKYKFYFFDYLYYIGEKTGGYRMSGCYLLCWYWGLILFPFLQILFGAIENSDTERVIFLGWALFPFVFCFFRYRGARKSALMIYYEGKKHVSAGKLMFVAVALFMLEQWLFGALGWSVVIRLYGL